MKKGAGNWFQAGSSSFINNCYSFRAAALAAGEEAAKAADRPLGREPAYPPMLRLKAAVSGLLGRTEEGRHYVGRLLEINPAASVSMIEAYYAAPLRHNPAILERFVTGLQRVGLPEA